MSDVALREVDKIPEPERMNGSLRSPLFKASNDNFEENQKKRIDSLVDFPVGKVETINSGVEVVISDVEYIDSENLKDVEDAEKCLETLMSALDSKHWVSVCDALNDVRRLSIFHKEAITSILSDVISLVVKSLKNPRSALCKTAIMASADIFKVYKDVVIDSVDPLLLQLLLKSSQDKRFVCEAAESALIALTNSVSPLLLLPKLQPYIKNRNPRLRAKASICISRSVSQMGADEIKAFGVDKLIQVGASQLSDQLPESRDAARALLLELHSTYEKLNIPEATSPDEVATAASCSWEEFCQSKLSPLSAQAVVRVTNNAREGQVVDS